MKKIVKILCLLFIVIGFNTGCQKNEEITDSKRFKEEYESLNGTINDNNGKIFCSININKNNKIIYKEAGDIVDMINNKETFVVYFGFSECPWCRSVVPTLIDVSLDLGVEPIYYVDVKNIRDTLSHDEDNNVITTKEGTEGYYELLKKLNDVLADYTLKDSEGNNIETNEKRIYAPNIVAIVEGKEELLTEGISDLETDPYMELTDEIKNDMYEKISCVLSCVSESYMCSNKSCEN